MKTSQAGVALIKKFEGCRLEAYQDVVGVWTIGYGDTSNVRPATRITQQQAEDRLANRLAQEFEPGVTAGIGSAPATQAQFDAMVSLAWNIGVGRLDDPNTPENEGKGFKGSSVARFHRAGDYAAAADAFLLWDKAGGRVLEPLQRRRAEERALYLSEASAEPAENIPGNIPAPCPANDNDIDADLVADLVRALQRVVDTAPDGKMGPKTYEAVLQAQRRAA